LYRGVVWLGVLAGGWTAAAATQVINLKSGNGSVGGADSQIRFTAATACMQPLRTATFNAADFLAARTGPNAQIINPFSPWIAVLPNCPTAKWIAVNQQGGPYSALYAIRFDVSLQCLASARLDICWAADDILGDFGSGIYNPDGLYLTNSAYPGGVNIPGSGGGNYASETCRSYNISGLVATGQNWLYVYVRDGGCAVGGLNFCATLTLDTPTGYIQGCKFHDVNCDGVWDPVAEPLMPGWTIVLTNNATGQSYTTTTTGNGCYYFSGIPFGTYSLTEVMQPGWERCFPECEQYTVTIDCHHLDLVNLNFGNHRCQNTGTLINLSTGVDDGSGGLLPMGAPDDTWQLTCVPPGFQVPSLPAPAYVVTPIYWGGPLAGSQWISADPNGNQFGVLPQGDYCYEACFELCGCVNPYLYLQILEDDGATVYLNGINVTPSSPPCTSFVTPCTLSISNSPWLFRPGRNCITIVVANTPAFATPTGLDVAGFIEAPNTCCHEACPCARPPRGMTGWWPLDETTGSTANDLAAPAQNGTHSSAGLTLAVGAVNNARNFNGTDYVQVAHSPQLTPTVGRFSVDAWIRLPLGGSGMIVSKTQQTGPNSWAGFDFYVTAAGDLALSLYSGAGGESFVYSGVNLADRCWHHVAATVKRLDMFGVKLYVDGVSQFFPTSLAGSLGNTSVLRIGAPSYTLTGGLFAGVIDEVEFFRRMLTPVEVDAIFQARSEGKCRGACYVPSVTGFCQNAGSVIVPVTVCNYEQFPQTFTISGALLGAGGPCNISGAGAIISPATQSITLPPGACGTKYFTITRPTAMTFAGATACFQFTIVSATTGERHTCDGTIVDQRDICPHVWCPKCWPYLHLAAGELVPVSLELQNTGLPAGETAYRAAVRDHDTGEIVEDCALNGLPPGEPVIGWLTLPPPGGPPAAIDIELVALDLSSLTHVELLIEVDANGDGEFEPLYAIGVTGDPGPLASAAWCDDFDAYATGAQLAGQGGWKGWDNNPAAGALTSGVQARSVPNSVAIGGASDLVHEYAGASSGRWVFQGWQFVPGNFQSHCDALGNCGTYLLLLNTYQDGGPYSWSGQLHADSITDQMIRDGATPATLPLVYDAWAEIKVIIDLTGDWFRVFYNGTELGASESWSGAFPNQTTPGVVNVGALDLFANQSTVVYYDDLCLTPIIPLLGDLNCDGVLDFDDINPFVLALSDPVAYQAAYPECYVENADCNGDGVVDFDDINAFVALLSQ
jgi:hypothetical protein